MARMEQPPFGRGETFGTTDSTFGTQYEGKDWVFEDFDFTNKVARTNRYVKCRVVRNVSTVTLAPKQLVQFKKSGTNYGAQVDGYATGTGVEPGAVPAFPVDEFLPGNVAINDLFYIVMEGPAMCLTTLDNSSTVDIAVGDLVAVAATAAGTTGTTGGRIEGVSAITGPAATTQQNNLNQWRNAIGRALSAASSHATNTAVLVEICRW